MSRITKALTGHLYFRSAYELYDSCGNCTGAKCDTCREIYEYRGNMYDSYDEAVAAEKKHLELFIEPPCDSDGVEFVIVKDKLNYVGRIWNGKSWVDEPVLLNQAAERIEAIRAECLVMEERWKKCSIEDKHEECLSCGIGMCRDCACYREMQQGKRTEKKWYL